MYPTIGERPVQNAVCDADLPLVIASRNSDVDTFEELVKEYDRKLYRLAKAITHSDEGAEEAVQTAFMKAFQNLHRFRGNAKFSTWLVRIAMNEAFRTLRKQRSNRDQPVDTGVFAGHNKGHDPLDLTEWAATPESLYRANELRQILENCLQKLQARLRVVFILRDVEGHSVSEISGILNLSATAVRTRLSRARFQLREELTPYFKRTSTVTKSRPKRH